MTIQSIHAFLAHPKKGKPPAAITNGSIVPLSGKIFELLNDIYATSENDCDIDIKFKPSGGSQQNPCRSLICAYIGSPSVSTGADIASRLESCTDGRSGLGLLFLILGKIGSEHKVVLSRFPTDNAIYVKDSLANLQVEFLERVFMKNKASYKAVVYRHSSVQSGFWLGRAVDKQIARLAGDSSNYWIVDFLESEFTLTPAAGTRRLAAALRAAASKVSADVRQEIVAAATLAPGLGGRVVSASEFCDQYSFSSEAKAAVLGELKSAQLAGERFQFDVAEFKSIVAFRSVELNNGVTITAPTDKFDQVIAKRDLSANGDIMYTTQGKILNQKLTSHA